MQINILTPGTSFFSDVMKRFLKNITGRDKIGLGREIFEASRPSDVKNLKPMANPDCPKLAIALCKYRTSNHKLEVETGRHTRPLIPRMDRKCSKCNLNETGNKIHHLMVCPKYLELRQKFIPQRFTNRVSLIRYLNLMSNKNTKILTNLARYIIETMKDYR